MDAADLIREFPFMNSPAALLKWHFEDKYTLHPFHMALDDVLLDAGRRHLCGEGVRVGVNCEQRVGKTLLSSVGFPAWILLWNPDTRIVAVGHNEKFAIDKFGDRVKKIVDKWGPALGIRVRPDMKAKGNWQIEGRLGGLICLGPDSSGTGHDADLFVVDDLIGDPKDLSYPRMLENLWTFYQGVVRGRLQTHSSLVMVGSRWHKNDHFGRAYAQAKELGEKWEIVMFRAICEERDCDPKTGRDRCGRKPGEALCPELVSLKQLEGERKTNQFWSAAWQQDPLDEKNALFRPRTWPRYVWEQNRFFVPRQGASGIGRTSDVIQEAEVSRICVADWAYSEKRWADRTAFGCFGLLPDGRLLILELVAGRWAADKIVPTFDRFCKRWNPHVAACESGGMQDMTANECRKHPNIPEVHRLKPYGPKNMKVVRAFPAVQMGSDGKILFPGDDIELAERAGEFDPECGAEWLDPLMTELEQFTGLEGDADDRVDVLSYAALLAGRLRPQNVNSAPGGPCVLTPGRVSPV